MHIELNYLQYFLILKRIIEDLLSAKYQICDLWNLVRNPQEEEINFLEKIEKSSSMLMTEILCCLIATAMGVEKIDWSDLIYFIKRSPQKHYDLFIPEHISSEKFIKFADAFFKRHFNNRTCRVMIRK